MGLLNKEKMAKWAMHMSRCVFQIRGYSEYKAPEGGRGEREERERERGRERKRERERDRERERENKRGKRTMTYKVQKKLLDNLGQQSNTIGPLP
jgi:hypothetical protein